MIPTREDIDVTGDLEGTKIRMQISSRATQHLMSILTNLYGDPMQAVIREYSTNAADSHVEAGQTRPIEISTPTDLNRTFIVQDYGVGLSFEDIEQIYSQYGESTKRGTNTQNGMLGLGSKSALTFTNQFYVRSVKDGWLISVIVHRDGEGAVMEVVERKTTDEQNGVKITIPVSGSIYAFNESVKKFFRFWKPGTVLIDGKQPEFPEGAKWLSDKFVLIPTADAYSKDYVVMGNVPYPVTENSFRQHKYTHRYSVVAYVDIGAVDFTPSREGLHYTDRTNQVLSGLRYEYENLLLGLVDKEIDAAKDHKQAYEAFMQWRVLITNLGKRVYKGIELRDSWDVSDAYKYNPNAYSRKTLRLEGIGLGELTRDDRRVIVDFSGNRPSSSQMAKIRKYFEDNDPNFFGQFLIFKDMPGSPWTDDIKSVSWKDISKIKIPRPPRPAAKTEEYDYFRGNSTVQGIDETQLKAFQGDIVYFSSSEFIRDKNWMHKTFVAFSDTMFVRIPVNRHAKFKAKFPHARAVREYVQTEFKKYLANLTDAECMAIGNSRVDRPWRDLDASRIDDPRVKRVVEQATQVNKPYALDNMVFSAYHFGVTDAYDQRTKLASRIKADVRALQDYPLAGQITSYGGVQSCEEEIYFYLNEKWKRLKKEAKKNG